MLLGQGAHSVTIKYLMNIKFYLHVYAGMKTTENCLHSQKNDLKVTQVNKNVRF